VDGISIIEKVNIRENVGNPAPAIERGEYSNLNKIGLFRTERGD